MIIIKDSHILVGLTPCISPSEVEEFQRLRKTANLTVSIDCLDAFCKSQESNSSPSQLVARNYKHHNHLNLMCAGGFTGRCHVILKQAPPEVAEQYLSCPDLKRPATSRKTSAAWHIPPELFPAIAQYFLSDYIYQATDIKQFSSLVLVCRHWSTLYRPMQWKHLFLTSRERIYTLLALLRSAPPGYTSCTSFVTQVQVSAIGIPQEPWIHLVPILLRRHLFSKKDNNITKFYLTITLKTNGLPSSSDKRVFMPSTHDCLPKSLAACDIQCNSLTFSGVDFHNCNNFLRIVRSFRRLEELECLNIGWMADAPETLELLGTHHRPPLRRITVQPFFGVKEFYVPVAVRPCWVSLLWALIRRQSYGTQEYLLEDRETSLAMQICALFRGQWRRKTTPTLAASIDVRKNCEYGANESQISGFDICFNVDKSSYDFIYTLTADSMPAIALPGETRGFEYFALHVEYITICPQRTKYSEPGLDVLLDHTTFWTLLTQLQFPFLRHIIVAVPRDADGELLSKLLDEHAPEILRTSGKLVVAKSDRSLMEEGCRWQLLDFTTFELTDRSCPCYRDGDSQSPDNIRGLSGLWTTGQI